ncbi:hypothetical protein ACB092_01G183600 [Castanea dentata]
MESIEVEGSRRMHHYDVPILSSCRLERQQSFPTPHISLTTMGINQEKYRGKEASIGAIVLNLRPGLSISQLI